MEKDISMSEDELLAMYNNDFGDMKSRVRERTAFLPRISLAVSKTKYKDKKGITTGDWFLTDTDTPEGEEPIYENLGKEFECVVLYDTMSISFYDDSEGVQRNTVFSSEFQDYSNDPVFLIDGRGAAQRLAAVCPYAGGAQHTIKQLRESPDFPHEIKDGEVRSKLSFNFNVYVLLDDGRLAVLSNTKRGHFGTDENGETQAFGSVSDDSFIRARADCHEKTPGITLAHRWRINSVNIGGGEDDIRPTFHISGINPAAKSPDIRDAATKLQKYLHSIWSERIGHAWQSTSPADRNRIITPYDDIRTLLNDQNGQDEAAGMILGKRAAPPLLSEPEPDYSAYEEGRRAEEARMITQMQDEEGQAELYDAPPPESEVQEAEFTDTY